MFDNLTSRLSQTIKNLSGQGRLTEKNIQDTLLEVKNSLLEADVALSVVKKFIEKVQVKAIGQEVLASLRPGDTLIKVVYDELVQVMGETVKPINLNTNPPAVILVAGLQGTGKTTTVAKMAKWLKNNENKKILLVSVDVYRPAAMEQLKILGQQIDIDYFEANSQDNPINIAQNAIAQAKRQFYDVVIIDTAGRLHVNNDMMQEVAELHKVSNPIETLLVVDSMTGQDAVNTAQVFSQTLPLTGIVLTKTDGDARGGAILSMKMLTEKPIKFLGTGEKIDNLELFYPDRIASRLLGKGDIISLVEEVQQKIDQKKAKKLAKKLQKGRDFDLEDFREQLQQLRKIGGMSSLLGKLPMGAGLNPQMMQSNKFDEKMFMKMEAIINSMTMKERLYPALIKASQKKRIAKGSGTDVVEINKMLKQFENMRFMMRKIKTSKKMQGIMNNMMQKMGNFS